MKITVSSQQPMTGVYFLKAFIARLDAVSLRKRGENDSNSIVTIVYLLYRLNTALALYLERNKKKDQAIQGDAKYNLK